MKAYLPRIMDEMLPRRLEAIGAVSLKGPKWCGKSTTAERVAASVLYFQNPDELSRNLEIARMRPSLLLQGARPRMIDEWQIAPQLWDAVRFAVDKDGSPGQFILTGSAVPPITDKILHSGIGRIVDVRMRTMSLFESGESNGQVSLRELFAGAGDISGLCELTLDDYAYLLCRGGWPQSVKLKESAALMCARNYYAMLTGSDMSRIDGVKREEYKVRSFLKAYARVTATQANASAIMADMSAAESKMSISRNTVAEYADVLRRLYVIEDLEAWHPALLRKETLRTSPTRHFADPSIACAALGIVPGDLLNEPRTFGYFFESMAIRDLRAYADSMDGEVLHYHDKGGLEADAVVHLPNGRFGLVEVKLYSQDGIDSGADNLKRIAAKLQPERMPQPSFMAVITGGGIAYRREDGVYVIPLGCLRH